MTYAEKLKDPRWQKKRLEIFNRDSFRCQLCDDDSSTLIVHHKKYLPKTEPWEYDINLLITLCEGCHKKVHPEKNIEATPVVSEKTKTAIEKRRTAIKGNFVYQPVSIGQLSEVKKEITERKNAIIPETKKHDSVPVMGSLSKIRQQFIDRQKEDGPFYPIINYKNLMLGWDALTSEVLINNPLEYYAIIRNIKLAVIDDDSFRIIVPNDDACKFIDRLKVRIFKFMAAKLNRVNFSFQIITQDLNNPNT